MDLIIKYIFPSVMMMVALATIFVRTGKMLQKLEIFGKRMEKAENKIDDIEKNMMPEDDCRDRHRNMNESFCKKIDDIKSMIEKIEEKRDRAVEINDQRWMKVFARLGGL